jgi:VIT1/CCC1 family predicted Fe2+/Mn2+ transporter
MARLRKKDGSQPHQKRNNYYICRNLLIQGKNKQIKITMTNENITPQLRAAINKAQIDEVTGTAIYAFMAKREKNPDNKKVLQQMSLDEENHAAFWKTYTHRDVKPKWRTLTWLKILTVLLGMTFVIKKMQKAEDMGAQDYDDMQDAIPQAHEFLAEEKAHEEKLQAMLDEERLHYVGALVLGLNDALVELTGALVGSTFAMMNNKVVAVTGIIIGISSTLSMAASNYLAERASGGRNAMKSSIYTGASYLITVILLVLPYLLLPTDACLTAFIIMIMIVFVIILAFNYYIAVAKDEPFMRNFLEMIIISASVAVITFVIGIVANDLLGINVK